MNGIKNTLSEVSGGHGIGIVYWEPGWIGNDGVCLLVLWIYKMIDRPSSALGSGCSVRSKMNCPSGFG